MMRARAVLLLACFVGAFAIPLPTEKQIMEPEATVEPNEETTVEPKVIVEPNEETTVEPEATVKPNEKTTVEPKAIVEPNEETTVEPEATMEPNEETTMEPAKMSTTEAAKMPRTDVDQTTETNADTSTVDSDDTTLSPAEKKFLIEIKSSLDMSVSPCDNFYQFVCGNYKKKSVAPSRVMDDGEWYSDLLVAAMDVCLAAHLKHVPSLTDIPETPESMVSFAGEWWEVPEAPIEIILDFARVEDAASFRIVPEISIYFVPDDLMPDIMELVEDFVDLSTFEINYNDWAALIDNQRKAFNWPPAPVNASDLKSFIELSADDDTRVSTTLESFRLESQYRELYGSLLLKYNRTGQLHYIHSLPSNTTVTMPTGWESGLALLRRTWAPIGDWMRAKKGAKDHVDQMRMNDERNMIGGPWTLAHLRTCRDLIDQHPVLKLLKARSYMVQNAETVKLAREHLLHLDSEVRAAAREILEESPIFQLPDGTVDYVGMYRAIDTLQRMRFYPLSDDIFQNAKLFDKIFKPLEIKMAQSIAKLKNSTLKVENQISAFITEGEDMMIWLKTTLAKTSFPTYRKYDNIFEAELPQTSNAFNYLTDVTILMGYYQLCVGSNTMIELVGRIGTILGHEYGHTFDPLSMEELDILQDNQTRANYERRVEMLKAAYASYEFERNPDFKINPNTTVGENAADFFGYKVTLSLQLLLKTPPRFFSEKVAYRAHRKHVYENMDFLPSQKAADFLYFITAGQGECWDNSDEYIRHLLVTDEHTVPEPRLNIALRNFPPFAAAFGCTNDDYMKAENPVGLW